MASTSGQGLRERTAANSADKGKAPDAHDHEHEHDHGLDPAHAGELGHSHSHSHSLFGGHSHSHDDGHDETAEKVIDALKGSGPPPARRLGGTVR